MRRFRLVALTLAVAIGATACSDLPDAPSDDPSTGPTADGARYPEDVAFSAPATESLGSRSGLFFSGHTFGGLLTNGSFETGDFTGWTTDLTGFPLVPWQVTGGGVGTGFGLASTAPQDGAFVAWNSFDGFDPMEFILYQDVTLPAGAWALNWQHRIQWDFTFAGAAEATQPRTLEVQVRDPGDNSLLATLFSFSTGTQSENPTGDTGWQTQSANLTPFAGSTVRIYFVETIPEILTGPGQAEFDAIEIVPAGPEELQVSIDIKPGSDVNPINVKSRGVIPVAILSTAAFDATTVDVATVTFGPGEASPAHDDAGHLEDVDDDGDTDLVLHFRTQESGLADGDTEACVAGATLDGTPLTGCDAVRVLDRGNGPPEDPGSKGRGRKAKKKKNK